MAWTSDGPSAGEHDPHSELASGTDAHYDHLLGINAASAIAALEDIDGGDGGSGEWQGGADDAYDDYGDDDEHSCGDRDASGACGCKCLTHRTCRYCLIFCWAHNS